MSNAFTAGVLAKLAASANPAAPVKQSKGDGPIDMGLPAQYLNMGGGKAAKQKAGDLNVHAPQGAYLNSPPGTKATAQEAGDVGTHSSPDTGDLGMSVKGGGEHSTTKSAAFEAGFDNAIEPYVVED